VLELARAVLAQSGYDVSDALGSSGPRRVPCAVRHQQPAPSLPGRPRLMLPLAALEQVAAEADAALEPAGGWTTADDDDDGAASGVSRLLEAAAAVAAVDTQTALTTTASAPLDDPAWARIRTRHAPYLEYLRGLARETARASTGGRQQRHEALVALALAQASTADAWPQCAHLLRVFAAEEQRTAASTVGAADARLHAALLRRLSAGRVASPRAVAAQGPAERSAYAAFLGELLAGARRAVVAGMAGGGEEEEEEEDYDDDEDGSTSTSSSVVVVVPASGRTLAAVAYGAAALGAGAAGSNGAMLLTAVAEASLPLLERQASSSSPSSDEFQASDLASIAWAFATAAEGRVGMASSSPAAARAAAAAVGASGRWRRALCAAALPFLQQPQQRESARPLASAAQVWGLAWGVARLGGPAVDGGDDEDDHDHDKAAAPLLLPPPEGAWQRAVLAVSRARMAEMDAEALAHVAWAVAATMNSTVAPSPAWLRALTGALTSKARSLRPAHLARAIPALAALGAAPRREVGAALAAACRRHLHAMTAPQLALVARAFAASSSSGGWHPGELFLYEFCTHSRRAGLLDGGEGGDEEDDEEERRQQLSGGWTGREAAAVAWSLARMGYVPDDGYLAALSAHLRARLLRGGGAASAAGAEAEEAATTTPRASADADALAMCLYAFASMRRAPGEAWFAAWCAAARARMGAFDAASLSTAAWALGELCGGGGGEPSTLSLPPLLPLPPPSFMRALTRRASAAMLARDQASSSELAALASSLAALRWRPSDAWLLAFASACSAALPAADRGQRGLEEAAAVLHALARLGAPLSPPFLRAAAAAARRRFDSLVRGGGAEGTGPLQAPSADGSGGRNNNRAATEAAQLRHQERREASAAAAALALARLAWALAQYGGGGAGGSSSSSTTTSAVSPRAAKAWWRDYYAAWTPREFRAASPQALAMLVAGVADHAADRGAATAPPPAFSQGLEESLRRALRSAAARTAVAAALAGGGGGAAAAVMPLAEYLDGGEDYIGACLRRLEDDEAGRKGSAWAAGVLARSVA
jgi:hypothetical protein